ncbi:MAG: beta-lactamase family protein [Gammaproteobacteria bacterium]|nr:beta-lactamase family protein [Gammaproteobacteria bacterium]
MKILLIIFASILFIAASAAIYLKYRLNNTTDNGDLEASLDAEIEKISKKGLSYGLVIGIYKNGKSFFKGYGTINKKETSVPNASTVFQLASVSKLFTSSLLQILSDEGVADMDATLDQLIGNSTILSSSAKLVTLRQLATHTSGFPRIPKALIDKVTRLAGKENAMVDPYSHIDLKDVLDYLENTQGKHKPGKFKYSNYGMGLLGHVLEIITKKDLESLATEKIFKPLDMISTAIALTPEMQKHLAQGYTTKGEPTPLWTCGALDGAGCFNSSGSDMMKFVQANIDDKSFLIQTFKKMHKQQSNGKTGIGWMQPGFAERFIGNKSVIWHNGLVGGYGSYVSIDLKAKTGVFILSNMAIDPSMIGMMITRLVRTQSWSP